MTRPTAARPADLSANASAAMAAVLFGGSVVAALLAILLLDERRSGLFLVGFAAVLTGMLLVNWPAHRP